MAERDEVFKKLLNEDDDFRNWNEEHRRHENRLAILTAKLSLSADEELEEKTLKKRKLILKDQMEERLRSVPVAR
jgi:uncharacterized protein YdcH (DUF465 family)